MNTLFKIIGFPARMFLALLGLLLFVVVKMVEPETTFKEFWRGSKVVQ